MQTQTKQTTIEWAPFETNAGVSAEQLLAAADVIERAFLSKQPGYMRRELLSRGENKWVDMVYWRDAASAALAAQAAGESAACLQYSSLMQAVDDAEQGISHFAQVKMWN
jgi:hypothetical protein